MEVIESLMQFGLTHQEATIYLTLNTEGALTGYEISKLTGISRSNAYTALANLTEKGAASLAEGEKKLYSPVQAKEFCSNKLRALEKTADAVYENMPAPKEEYEGYLTIRGRRNSLDRMITMIGTAEERIYLSMHGAIIKELEEYLTAAITKGLKVVVITNENLELPGATIYRAGKKIDEIRLIADSHKVLTGDIKDSSSSCLYSAKRNLVELLKESLTNEIELIKIRGEK